VRLLPTNQHNLALAMNNNVPRIRALNDELRQHLLGGCAVITLGVAALGPEFVERVIKTIAVFDDITTTTPTTSTISVHLTLRTTGCSLKSTTTMKCSADIPPARLPRPSQHG
jgi:hypothetical protein